MYNQLNSERMLHALDKVDVENITIASYVDIVLDAIGVDSKSKFVIVDVIEFLITEEERLKDGFLFDAARLSILWLVYLKIRKDPDNKHIDEVKDRVVKTWNEFVDKW